MASGGSTVVGNAFRDGTGAAENTGRGPNTSTSATAQKKSIWSWSLGQLLNVMRLANFCNGLCLATFAILAMIPITGSSSLLQPSFTTVTVAAYTALLGLLMCCVELNFTFIQTKLRRRCGFYFSFMGRALVIFFSGTMALALIADDSTLGIYFVIGGATCVNALFNLIMILFHPSFRKVSVAADPWASKVVNKDGKTVASNATMENDIAAYIKAHPEIAAKAVSTGMTAAASMPRETRVQAARGVANPFRAMFAGGNKSDNPVVVQHHTNSATVRENPAQAPRVQLQHSESDRYLETGGANPFA